jgi:hypothetical protein
MAGNIFGAFYIFFVLDVVLQPSVKRKSVTGCTAPVGKLVTGQNAVGSHSEALA